jgi:hypothetical protein
MAATTTPEIQPDKIVSLAVVDLSNRLSLDRQQVRVVSVESAVWPDAAPGCPRPSETYAEQAGPGYLIVLEANGQNYAYHADTSGAFFLCDSAVEEDSPSKDPESNVQDGRPNETKDKDVIITTPSR